MFSDKKKRPPENRPPKERPPEFNGEIDISELPEWMQPQLINILNSGGSATINDAQVRGGIIVYRGKKVVGY